MGNANCSCPHVACPMHGDCKQCMEFHKGRPYCKVGNIKKAQMRVVFNVYDAVQDMKKKAGSKPKSK